jgi:hypothetical protein
MLVHVPPSYCHWPYGSVPLPQALGLKTSALAQPPMPEPLLQPHQAALPSP